ncbi:MAG: bifunctional riboflavin kinase/FAD synthetase [Chloroflexota bacterium]
MTTDLTFKLTPDSPQRPTVLTIGVFDGLHLGHQTLVDATVAEARQRAWRAVAMTFWPHPRSVVGRGGDVQYLCTLPERRALLRRRGLNAVATLHFTREVAGMEAAEFMRQIKSRLDVMSIWVGSDFALGRGREGTPPVLAQIGRSLGIDVQTVPPVTLDGTVVSSSTVRALLQSGELTQANRMLGRAYAFHSIVVPGERRGRTLGFPTANLTLPRQLVVPANGVYVVTAQAGFEEYFGVANIGTRPSFGTHERNLEVHLLDYAGELYGRPLRVAFLKRLRAEEGFSSIEALVAQMNQDVANARAYLSTPDALLT